MRRFILILAVVWSVAGAPAFCRAGLLVTCCSHDTEPAAPNTQPECAPADCHCPNPEPNHQPVERECGSCVFACGAVAKLSHELNTAFDWHPIQVSIDRETLRINDAGFAGDSWIVARSDPPGLSFPPSDIPLQI